MKKILDRYRYSIILLKQLVKTDFKIRYQNSILGYLWTLLRPLFLFAILYVVFVKILGTLKGIPHSGVYLLLGIIIWNYFVEVSTGSVGSIVAKGDMMRKVNFPRYVIVLAGSFAALINLFFNLVIVGLFMILFGTNISISAIFFPLIIVELFIFSLAVGFLLSALFVKFRDVGFIWDVIIQAAFFAIPIMYAYSFVTSKSEPLGKLFMCNPITQMMQQARYMLVTKEQTPTISSLFGTHWAILIPLAIVAITTTISVVYFKKESPYFAENV